MPRSVGIDPYRWAWRRFWRSSNRGVHMTRKILAVVFAVAAAGTVAAGTASAATSPTVAYAHTNVVRDQPPRDPPHDPHCTRDGNWHNDERDGAGHQDNRCFRW
jgi:hypothetical protein